MEENKINDNVYIDAVRSGDSEAFSSLLDRYRPLTESLVSSFTKSTREDESEIRSEAEYALYRAACSFDTAQCETTFGLYAKICIRNDLTTKFSRKKRPEDPVSLEELLQSGKEGAFIGEGEPDPAVVTLSEESLSDLKEKIRGVLSEYELSVFYLWAEGDSAKEIGEKLHRDEKSVSNAVSRSLAKLRSALA